MHTNTQGFYEWLEKVRAALPGDLPVYLVGGAVRDMLLRRPTHDLDFVVPAGGTKLARRVADSLGASYFPLDEERDSGRVVQIYPDGQRQVLDFAVQRGPDLESDLRARDFTINAIALSLNQPQALIDPLGGAADLLAHRLRACSPSSFRDDPVRVLRAVRMAAAFELTIEPETRHSMRQAVAGLGSASPERQRDELFRILNSPHPHTSLQVLDRMGVLPYLLPELESLKRVGQSPPHVSDVWEHSLDVLRYLEIVLGELAPQPDPDRPASLFTGLLAMRLGRYRSRLEEHLTSALNTDRSLYALLFLAALYHDIAKPQTRQVDEGGRVRFFDHDEQGAELAYARGRALRLSNPECERLKTIVRLHMRPLLLGQSEELPTRRAIYRFFRAAGEAGVEIALLSLADVLATYGPTLQPEVWGHHLDVLRSLLEAWWEHPQETVSPPAILTGHELIQALGLQPGPLVGQLLEAIREAQAAGRVHSREEALSLARAFLASNKTVTDQG